MPKRTTEYKPGVLSASQLNELVGVANAVKDMKYSGAARGSPMGPGNPTLHVDECREFVPIRLTETGTGGRYSWVEVEPINEAPFWQDKPGGRSGLHTDSNAAIEINSSDTIALETPGPYVSAWFEGTTKSPRFQFATCS